MSSWEARMSSKARIQHLERLAQHLASIGRLDAAAETVREALEADPDSSSLLASLADIEYRRDNNETAISLSTEALARDPGNTFALRVLASAHTGERQFVPAHEAANAAVEAAPHEAFNYFCRAWVCDAWNKHDAVQRNNGRRQKRRRRQRLERARADIDRAIELNPHESVFHSQKAHLLLAAKERELARASSRRALELDPHDSSALVAMASCDMAGSNLANARERLTSGLALTPDSPALHSKLRVVVSVEKNDPIVAMAVPAGIASVVARIAGGPPGTAGTSIVVIAIIAAFMYIVWWQRRLTAAQRAVLKSNGGSEIIEIVLMVVMFMGFAVGHLLFDPYDIPPFFDEPGRAPVVGELVWDMCILVSPLFVIGRLVQAWQSRRERLRQTPVQPDAF